jgi:carbon monoxide dehydrogenase subunit G
MRLEGQFSVKADQETVYEFLTNPQKVSRYMPDVTGVEILDPDHFTVTAKVGISHIKGTMVMKLAITERKPPVSMAMTGKGTGLGSVVDMVTSFRLEKSLSGETVVHWHGDANIGGKLAAFGPQGLLDRMGSKNVEKFIDGIKEGIGRLTAPSTP